MFFRKRKKIAKENPLQDKVAGKIAAGILKMQGNLADRMNKMRHLKILLIGFCFLSGSLSIYFFVAAIVAKPSGSIRIDRVRMPEHLKRSGDEMPEDIYRDIQEYKKYMDSIGEPIRPGLMDSIKVLEELYLSQKK